MNMMILHYLKSAVRSLMKYKVQTTASVIGLALGFVCFALSAVWVRYEQTFDSFHRGAGRMYLLEESTVWGTYQDGLKHRFLLADELKRTFPEVEEAAAYWHRPIPVMLSQQDSVEVNLGCIRTDSLFFRLFDVQLLKGSRDFLNRPDEAALTEEGARRLFGTADVLGRTLYCLGQTWRVSAVVAGWDGHTNFPFSILLGMGQAEKNNPSYGDYYISLRLRAEADTAALAARMNGSNLEYTAERWNSGKKPVLRLEPLTHCRYTVFQDRLRISMLYIRLCSVLGLLLIVLALVNFLSLLVSRMHVRRRELALRLSCGSSRGALSRLFLAELLLILTGAGLSGMILVEVVERPFCALSGIEGDILLPVSVCFLLLMAVTLL